MTGSSSFLGSRLVRALNRHGNEVRGVDRHSPVPGVPEPDLGLITGDIHDARLEPTLRRELARADVVFHLTGSFSGLERRQRAGRGNDGRDELSGAARLVAATPGSTPLVVVSGADVYGQLRQVDGRAVPSCESDPLHPIGPAATQRARIEQLCRAREAWGRVSIVRPFTMVGEGQPEDMAVARWLRAVLSGRPLEMIGSTTRARDVVDVELLVHALVACLDRAVEGQLPRVLNLGSGRPRTLREIAAAVIRVAADRVGTPSQVPLVVRPVRTEEPDATWACTRLAEQTLGCSLATDLDAVIARQLDHALAHGLLERSPDAWADPGEQRGGAIPHGLELLRA